MILMHCIGCSFIFVYGVLVCVIVFFIVSGRIYCEINYICGRHDHMTGPWWALTRGQKIHVCQGHVVIRCVGLQVDMTAQVSSLSLQYNQKSLLVLLLLFIHLFEFRSPRSSSGPTSSFCMDSAY